MDNNGNLDDILCKTICMGDQLSFSKIFDHTIEFHFNNSEKDESFDKDYPNGCREMEFEGIYKREFGILIDFEPSIIEEES